MKNVMAILGIPADYHVVQTTSRTRNGEPVTVERLQTSADITPNNAHITLVRNEAGTVISFNDSTFKAGLLLNVRVTKQANCSSSWIRHTPPT